MALERDRLPQACRGRCAPAHERAHESRSVPRARPRLVPPPRGAGSSDAGSAGRLRARPSATTPADPTRRNRFTGVVRSVDNGGVMAWVEIEAGPFLVTAAITRDAMEELALAPRRRGDGRREGDFRDDQAHLRRSIWASRMRPTCGLVIGAPSVPIRLPATASRDHPFVWDQRTRCGSRRQTRDSRWGGLNPRRSTVLTIRSILATIDRMVNTPLHTSTTVVRAYVALTAATVLTLVLLSFVAPQLATGHAWGHAIIVVMFAVLLPLRMRAAREGKRSGLRAVGIISGALVAVNLLEGVLPGFLPTWMRVEVFSIAAIMAGNELPSSAPRTTRAVRHSDGGRRLRQTERRGVRTGTGQRTPASPPRRRRTARTDPPRLHRGARARGIPECIPRAHRPGRRRLQGPRITLLLRQGDLDGADRDRDRRLPARRGRGRDRPYRGGPGHHQRGGALRLTDPPDPFPRAARGRPDRSQPPSGRRRPATRSTRPRGHLPGRRADSSNAASRKGRYEISTHASWPSPTKAPSTR